MEACCLECKHLVKAYTIVLRGHDISENISIEAVAAAAQHNVELQIHDAVVGYDAPPIFEQYGITRFLNAAFLNMPGHHGCFLSHFQLWKKCVELDEPILITEHDGIFIRDIPKDVNDHYTDVLRLDSYQAWKPEYEQLVQQSLSEPIGYKRPEPHSKTYGSGPYCVGYYGYMIKPSGAQKLIDHAINIGANATEMHIGMDVVDIMTTTATIIRLHPFYVNAGLAYSTTYELGIFKEGYSMLPITQYAPPSELERLRSSVGRTKS